jgi:hypothetical protein
MRKAMELARRETERINNGRVSTANSNSDEEASESPSEQSASDDEIKSLCHNGKCTWKVREKYDNVHRELTGYSSSDEE